MAIALECMLGVISREGCMHQVRTVTEVSLPPVLAVLEISDS